MILQSLSHFTLHLITVGGYSGIFVLSFLENLCVPIPSEIVMPFSGFLAASGQLSIVWVLVVATAANWLGSVLLYFVFKSGGRALITRYGRYVLLSSTDIVKWDRVFARHGSAVVFWARLIPTARALVSIPAGIARMSFKKFALYTFVGSAIWNAVLMTIGYKTGQHWDFLGTYFHELDKVILIAIVMAIVWSIIHKISKK